MNKAFSIAAIVALVTTLSFAEGLKIGARAALNINYVSIDADAAPDLGFGFGGGGGLVAVIPISGDFAVRTGAEFGYRTLYSDKLADVKSSATEFALNIPVTVQYTYSIGENSGAFMGFGVQFDIPFASEIHVGDNSSEFKDRSAFDLGIIVNCGFNITENIAFDIRGTIENPVGLALTTITTDKDNKSYLYGGSFGFTYFF
ncbi:MAG: outer membrane beta-barrel protein [Fibromonadales bacterium]|nr:outer membrane beta-barrel protein [Fibromonadales bacterium]